MVAVGRGVAVIVGVEVFVGVGVKVFVAVGVDVSVGSGVRVGRGVTVGVFVGVGRIDTSVGSGEIGDNWLATVLWLITNMTMMIETSRRFFISFLLELEWVLCRTHQGCVRTSSIISSGGESPCEVR